MGRGPENTPREKRLVAMYVARFFPGRRTWLNQQIGPVPIPPDAAQLPENVVNVFKAHRRRADAIIDAPEGLIVVEAKMKPDGSEIGQLLLYQRLIPSTPELAEFATRRIVPVIVAFTDDPMVASIASSLGIRFVNFRPKALEDSLKNLPPSRLRGFQESLQPTRA